MKSVVVHQGSPEAVEGVAHHLRQAGVDAWVLDQPNFIVLMVSFGTYKSRVAVPKEQEAEAREVLRRWSEAAREEVRGLTGQLRLQVILASLVSALCAGWAYTTSATEDMEFLLSMVIPVSWLLAFLVIASVARFRQRGR